MSNGLRIALFVWAGLVLVVFCGFALDSFSGRLEGDRSKEIAATLRRGALQCYAIEGSYPPSLVYLEQHYALQVDASRYQVYYQSLGANLFPQILVAPVDAGY